MNKSENKKLNLFLGDIIKIIAPDNSKFHDKIYYIDYIDDKMIKIINKTSEDFLYLGENGQLTELSIKEIHIVKRNKVNSYALLNNLNLDTWIDIKFGGELPFILTGIITNLIEDMIEIETFPNKDVIFIDFAYKGIPIDLNIEYIQIREEPLSYRQETRIQEDEVETEKQKLLTPISEEDSEENEKDIELSESQKDKTIKSNTLDDIDDVEEVAEVIPETETEEFEIDYDEFLEPVIQYVNVAKEKQIYLIEEQIDDMVNKYLDKVPDHKKESKEVKNKINKLINRFEDLRNSFTIFDENEYPSKIKTHGSGYNTLKNILQNTNNKFKHIIPVTSIRKKIYDDNSLEDNNSIYLTSNNELNDDLINNTQYFDKTINYDEYMNIINDSFIPYLRPLNKNNYYSIKVKHDINTIIDNDDLYEINTIGINEKDGKTKMFTKKYFQQKYLSELKFNEKIIMLHEILDLKSIITLPFNYAMFNNIDIKTINIMEKYILSNNNIFDFQIFNDKLNLNTNLITDQGKKFENNKNYENVFTKVTEHILDDDIQNNDNNYLKFISTALPNTSNIVKYIIENYKKLSLFEYCKLLECYNINIYDLHFNEYKMLLDALYKNINTYWEYYKSERKLFNKDIGQQLKHKKRLYAINFLDILENTDPEILLEKNYKSHTEFVSNSEYLSYINKYDGGKLLVEMLKLNTSKLINNVDIDYNKDETIKNNNTSDEKCETYIISKKYNTLEQLNNDNNKEVFYDKVYDDNVYDILNVYKEDQNNMKPEDFKKFLIGKLIEVNGIDETKSSILAEDIIDGRKKVREGDYCILHKISDDYEISDIEYYKRVNDKWEFDKNATEKNNNALNINDKLCNDIKCIENPIKSKDLKFNFKDNNLDQGGELYEKSLTDIPINKSLDCIPTNVKKENIKQKLLSIMIEEFKHQHLKSRDNIENNINIIIQNNIKLQNLRNIQKNQYQNFAIQIGSKTIILDNIKSPYSELSDEILSMDDLFERNLEILKFIHKYTRSAIYPENKYWYYCKSTNIKLLPTFYFKIALVIVQSKHSFDNSKYIETIDMLYREQGREEDGFIIDKHSEHIIAPIDYNNDEGYDESGHKLVSRSVVETVDTKDKDENEYVLDLIETKELSLTETTYDEDEEMLQEDLYKTNIKEFITVIVNYITGELNIDLGPHKEFIIYKTIIIFEKYKTKKNEEYTLVLLTIAMIFIGVQMFFPRMTGKYIRVNDCKASFKGYPLENENNYEGINFFSCLIAKRRKKINKKLKQTDETKIKEQLITIIKSFILDNIQDEIIDIKKKEEEKYKLLSVFIKKNLTYLPPLNKFNVSKMLLQNNLSNIKSTIKQKTDVLTIFNALKSKNILYSYALIELINDNIENVELNLQNHSTNEFYLENSCCSSNTVTNIINYLSEKETDIMRYINIVDENEKYISKYINTINISRSKEIFKKNILNTPNKYTNKTIDLFFEKYKSDDYQEKTYAAMMQKLNETYTIYNKHKINKIENINYDDYLSSLFSKNESIDTDMLNTKIIEYIEFCKDQKEMKDIIINKVELTNLLNTKISTLKTQYNNFTNKKFTFLIDNFITLKSNNAIQNIKNNILTYCFTLPMIVINNISHNVRLPKHWNLSNNHYKLINTLIDENYNLINKFKENDEIENILKHSIYKYKIYENTIKNIDVLPLNNIEYCIDKEMVEKILHYYFLSIINYTIDNITTLSSNKIYKEILNKYSSNFSIKNKIYDFDIKLLEKRVLKAKEAEKDRMTKKLKKKSKAEKQVSMALKKNKLGEWSIGEQKGNTVYDKNFRDVNRPEGDEAYYQLDIENELQDHSNEDN